MAEAGSGDPLVLLHGWPQHWYAWRKLIPTLAESYRVICPDLRGFGWSDAPPDGYEKDQFATDLLATLDALELGRVRLVGHDWGGFAGWLAAMREPKRFERYVCMDIITPWLKMPKLTPATVGRLSYQFLIMTPLLGRFMVQRVPSFMRASTSAAPTGRRRRGPTRSSPCRRAVQRARARGRDRGPVPRLPAAGAAADRERPLRRQPDDGPDAQPCTASTTP